MGSHSKVYYEIRDSHRIRASARKSSEKINKKGMKTADEDRDKQCEGTVYKAGDDFEQN